MTAPPYSSHVSGILLDVEGTTTPMHFVYEVLFPYARAEMKDFLNRHLSSEAVAADVARLRQEHAEDERQGLDPPLLNHGSLSDQVESIVTYIHWLMDRDRKSTPLKSLQGMIWEEGYHRGELQGLVFEDVPPALARWYEQGKDVRIFSSGSVLAQKLLFANTVAGDLTQYIRGHFDTRVGSKTDPESYRRISRVFDLPPASILFISDVTAELDAGKSAGLLTLLSLRPGNRPQAGSASHAVIHTFDELFP